jgi:hypothetical protein
MEFCLLGPLAVRCGGKPVPVPRGKQRAVLAALLLNTGRVVSSMNWRPRSDADRVRAHLALAGQPG